MTTLNITAVKDADNETTLNILDNAGSPLDLDALGVTEVFVKVCDKLYTAEIRNVTFSVNVITVAFGGLDLPTGTYKPKIIYISPTKPDGEVLIADGFETQILLKMVC